MLKPSVLTAQLLIGIAVYFLYMTEWTQAYLPISRRNVPFRIQSNLRNEPIKMVIEEEISTESPKRRRRRRKDSSTELQFPAPEQPTSDEYTPAPLLGCPFSMTFPRYSIELKMGKQSKQQGVGWLAGMGQSFDRPRFERIYQRSKFKWVEYSPKSKSRTADVERNMNAIVNFWDAVLVSGSSSETVALAFPNMSHLVVERIVNIYHWYTGWANSRVSDNYFPNVSLDSQFSVTVVVIKPEKKDSIQLISSNSEMEVMLTEKRLKSWVSRLLVDLEICPFTKSNSRSGQGLGDVGVPVAKIAYYASAAGVDETGNKESTAVKGIPLLMKDTWTAILEMVRAGDRGKDGVSSILLAAPGYDEYFELWAGPVFAMLESSVSALELEPFIGVVCFHPNYATPDGKSWPGFGHMHSVPRLTAWYKEASKSTPSLNQEQIAAGGAWQRRTPHAVVNVLRAEQLQAAEGRRRTGDLYARNIDVLINKVGSERLYQELQKEVKMNI